MNSEHKLSKPIVIENGSEYNRVGFAGDLKPRIVFKIGKNFSENDKKQTNKEDSSVLLKKGRNPIERGYIINSDDMISVWTYIFNELLLINPTDYPLLLIDPPLNPRVNREKIAEILFERFKIPILSLKSAPELTLSMMGIETGIVIDIGREKTDISVVWEGQFLPSDFRCINLGENEFEIQLSSISEQIYQQIKGIKLLCHGGVELRKICAQNIVLVGQSALIARIKEILKQELIRYDVKNNGTLLEFIIMAPLEPHNIAWIGGSKFAAQPFSQKSWITLEEYQENGAGIIHRL